ncbi:expressed unknown protein [Seminavis robusta]|uniref:Uncharacterized protein n=1 Tax=Seminavis robusta TaxID=568900 RepID=A0A9N8ECW8_9STRA|nr:expressed unknown protein [Seminavis robusta]|eukprot:Sro906_g218640.1 n/a (201) ;mRNA; r:30035-30637
MISTAVKTAVATSQRQAMRRGISSTATTTRPSCRAVGSKCRFLTTTTSNNAVTPPPAMKTTSRPPPPPADAPIPNEMQNPPDVHVEVTPEMKTANVALAAVLVGFVGGVWYYSMKSVGTQDAANAADDPLAQLKLEAQEAIDRQEKETQDPRAKQLLQEFSRGDHDPDKAEVDALEELEKLDEEEAVEKKKNKKSWWKFW